MKVERKPLYLVQVEDMMGVMEREKAVFSSTALALQFIKVQGLKACSVIEVADGTRDGLIALAPMRVYLRKDLDGGFTNVAVVDEDQTPVSSGTIWFDPLVPENGRGLGLYHSWIRNGQLDEPSLSFSFDSCSCRLSMAETPMLRKDKITEGVFHCFAESQEEASHIAHAMMKKHWDLLPVRAIAERGDWHLIEQEELTLDNRPRND